MLKLNERILSYQELSKSIMTNIKSDSIIYYKSSCITCKKTLSEIDRMKIDIQKRDFFKEPFSEGELKKIVLLVQNVEFVTRSVQWILKIFTLKEKIQM